MNSVSESTSGSHEPAPEAGLAAQVEAVRRRALPMGIVFGSVLATALLIAAFWPATYVSTGTILIEQQEIPQDFVRSSVSSYADERVQVISQRVMTSANLLDIISKYNLYGSKRNSMTREALVERMRRDIDLDLISANVLSPGGGDRKATIAFSVGFASESPEIAARVANDVVSLYLTENLKSRMQQVEGSTEFLASEAEKVRVRVAELEQRLTEFKQRNYDRLPELSAVNQQSMSNATNELSNIDFQLSGLEQRIEFLDTQLAQTDPNGQVVTGSGERLMGLSDRLKSLRLELTRALAVYTPKHPIVIGMQDEIASLEKQLAETRAGNQSPPDNPAYIQLQGQRREAVSQRDALRNRRAELQASVARYQSARAGMPAVEAEYGNLLREVQAEQAKYAELRQKQMTAQLSQNLETEQKGERFTLIEPPVQPEEPVRPNRPAILAIGLLLAVGAAVGVVVLLEAIDTRVRGRREVVALLGAPPLAVIPWVAPPEEYAQKRLKVRWTFAAGVAGGAVAALLLVHILVKPLDLLWAVLLRRLGV